VLLLQDGSPANPPDESTQAYTNHYLRQAAIPLGDTDIDRDKRVDQCEAVDTRQTLKPRTGNEEMLHRSIVQLCYWIVLDLIWYPLHILQMPPDPKIMFLELDAKHNDQLISHPRPAHH
jgi:hypothetical protein